MIEYFHHHRDSVAINDYLNKLDQESNDFLVVFCLRQMGEKFVDGTLSMEEVRDYAKYIPASAHAINFIRDMECETFYNAICNIALDNPLSPLEQKIKDEIEHPSFCKPKPSTGGWAMMKYKLERMWKSRWKHPLVYKEWWFPRLVTKIMMVIRNCRTHHS